MNKAIKTLLLADSLVIAASAMLAPLYAIYIEKIGGDILEAGSAVALYSFVGGLMIWVFSKFEDKMKESELAIVAGYFVISLAYFGYAFVDSIAMLFALQVLLGIGEAIQTPAFDGVYSKHLKKGNEVSGWGAWESMYRFITAIGALAGGILVTLNGFETIFFIMGMMHIIAGMIIWLSPRKLL